MTWAGSRRCGGNGTAGTAKTPLQDFNAWWEPLDFVLPETRPGGGWHTEVDTFGPRAADPGTRLAPPCAGRAGDKLAVGPRSVVVLLQPRPAGG